MRVATAALGNTVDLVEEDDRPSAGAISGRVEDAAESLLGVTNPLAYDGWSTDEVEVRLRLHGR